MHSKYTYKETQKNLVVNLQFSGELRYNVSRTKHRSESEAILPEEGVPDHGEAVLSEENDQVSMIYVEHTML